jgi:hypothetical protein
MIEPNVGGRDRLARGFLTFLLTIVAVGTFHTRQYQLAILALGGALGLGLNTITCFCGLNEVLGIDTTNE